MRFNSNQTRNWKTLAGIERRSEMFLPTESSQGISLSSLIIFLPFFYVDNYRATSLFKNLINSTRNDFGQRFCESAVLPYCCLTNKDQFRGMCKCFFFAKFWQKLKHQTSNALPWSAMFNFSIDSKLSPVSGPCFTHSCFSIIFKSYLFRWSLSNKPISRSLANGETLKLRGWNFVVTWVWLSITTDSPYS